MPTIPSRDDAYALLTEHTKNPNLVKHALCVEAGMRHYANHFGDSKPARATVAVRELPKGARVEIDCIAHVR